MSINAFACQLLYRPGFQLIFKRIACPNSDPFLLEEIRTGRNITTKVTARFVLDDGSKLGKSTPERLFDGKFLNKQLAGAVSNQIGLDFAHRLSTIVGETRVEVNWHIASPTERPTLSVSVSFINKRIIADEKRFLGLPLKN